ncbi:hypothetical protein GGI15_001499 [Coemansia interrupta]|uniref:C2H2-type domain-containing protein n=1 Tax=Coemansia interrupta TaxID=1126814 RepID=A0A9W8HL70_9FUNG|nr:hypothetical protein GGI15_001499 [Coemansia interrupta]
MAAFGYFSVNKTSMGAKRKMRLGAQQSFVCFYCGAIYENLDLYNHHVESQHYHER